MIAIKEFISAFEQGYAEAFLCRGEDDRLYVVKSRLSGRETLIREWMCGCIGRDLGLPIPPFEQAYASSSAAKFSGNERIAALAETPGFASRFVSDFSAAQAGLPLLNRVDVPEVDNSMRRRVLLFDWWVLNYDRSDENPNLLWDALNKQLHVIDHNLAFSNDPVDTMWSGHIFRNARPTLSDPVRRADDFTNMRAILARLPEIWSDMPDDWTDVSSLTLERVDSILRRCETDEFWRSQ